MKAKRNSIPLFCTAALLTLMWSGIAPAGEEPSPSTKQKPRVIVNPSVPDTVLEPADLRAIYAGRKTAWNDGSRIKLAVLRTGKCHETFLARFLRKTPSQFLVYWRKRIFAGHGRAPKIMESESKMLEYVRSTKGAIGYLCREPVKGTREVHIRGTAK